MSSYFNNSIMLGYGSASAVKRKEEFIGSRRLRPTIAGFTPRFNYNKGYFLRAGDILKLNFARGGRGYFFEGLCLAIRKRHFLNKNASLCLRNVISTIGIEIIASYYLHRLYGLEFSDYKRKRYNYSRRKLYHLVTDGHLATAV